MPQNKGFSTIELMIAMTIMTMVLSAVVVVAFGNQSFLIGGQTSAEAMNKAQELLEREQAYARKDFNLVNSTGTSTDDNYYYYSVHSSIVEQNPSSPTYLTKEVTASIEWKNERNSSSTLQLTTLISNFDTPVGNNTCESTPTGDWKAPQIEKTLDFSALSGVPSGAYTLTDVDAYRGKLYVTAGKTSASSDPTLFVFDISDPANPSLLGKVDNASGVTSGLNAVRVAQDPASSPVKTYAFAAQAANSDYNTCNPVTNAACGQLGVFDVTNPGSISGTNLMLASSTSPFVKGGWIGNSVFYRSGYVLLGLAKAGGTGPELHLVDVHNPATALFGNTSHIIFPVGTYTVGNDINAISMRGTYIYMASPNAQELMIASSSNPSSITLAGGFSAGSGNGKSLYLVGDRLYLGRTTDGGAGQDFQILDNTNPATTLPLLGGLDVSSSVNAVLQRDYLSYVLTNTALQIYRTDTPSSIASWATLALPQSGSATEPSMDCEGNRLYITSNNSGGNGYLYVVKPGP